MTGGGRLKNEVEFLQCSMLLYSGELKKITVLDFSSKPKILLCDNCEQTNFMEKNALVLLAMIFEKTPLNVQKLHSQIQIHK